MMLSEREVVARLAPRAVRFYARVDSTNDRAMAWLRAGAAAGSAVVADEQVKGRGRKGRIWHTPPGVALAVSVILRPPRAALRQVSMLAALAVAELCERTGCENVGIKWPNDVQIGGLKVAGVLPEIAWQGEHLQGVVLGMGVNVRIDFRGSELEDTAISLETALDRRLHRLDLLADLLERVDFWSGNIGAAAVYEAWRARLTTVGRAVTVEGANGPLRGIAEAVDERGVLWLRLADGELRRVVAGDVVMV